MKFTKDRWQQDADKYIEDSTDKEVYKAGLWADASLTYIRSQITGLTLWNLPIKALTRDLLAFVNSDAKAVMSKFEEVMSNPEVKPIGSYDELVYQNLGVELWGSQTATAILDTAVDSLDLCLRFAGGIKRNREEKPNKEIDFPRVLNFAAAYEAIENVFYEILWLDSSIKEEENYWELIPNDFEKEALLTASLRRHEELLVQTITSAAELWCTNRTLAKSIAGNQYASSVFQVSEENNKLKVKFLGRKENDNPPKTYLYQSVTAQLYYSPLVNTPLKSLENLTIFDLLNVLIELREIAHIVFERLPPSQRHNKNLTEMVESYCPLVHRSSVVKSIALSLKLDERQVSRLVDVLTWKEDKSSIYFCPVFSMNTPDELCVFFAFHPILSFNPYWVVDHWLSEFELSLDWRGNLFEEQIYRELNFAIQRCQFKELVKISNNIKLTADDNSNEEFDVIIKINKNIIVGEAKCHKFPISVLERGNYLATLETASKQALRKANWAKKHPETIANVLGITVNEIKDVFPLVVINHSIGVGLNINDVPVLDLLLLENYFARPYPSMGIVEGNQMTEIRGKPFYTNPTEFSENFYNYAINPYPIQRILEYLKPVMTYLPLGLEKSLGKIEFIIDTEKIPNLPTS